LFVDEVRFEQQHGKDFFVEQHECELGDLRGRVSSMQLPFLHKKIFDRFRKVRPNYFGIGSKSAGIKGFF
jgi:hypothetical protein